MVPHESLFRLLNEGLYHYFILISTPTASMDTAHSPHLLHVWFDFLPPLGDAIQSPYFLTTSVLNPCRVLT